MNWQSVFKGAAIAALGAVATYITQWATGTDFGSYSLIVGAVASTLVNIIHKLMTQIDPNAPVQKGKK